MGQQTYYIEFVPVGAQVKVIALCPETGTEVSIFGPASAGQEMLKRQAVRKLEYMKSRQKSPKKDSN